MTDCLWVLWWRWYDALRRQRFAMSWSILSMGAVMKAVRRSTAVESSDVMVQTVYGCCHEHTHLLRHPEQLHTVPARCGEESAPIYTPCPANETLSQGIYIYITCVTSKRLIRQQTKGMNQWRNGSLRESLDQYTCGKQISYGPKTGKESLPYKDRDTKRNWCSWVVNKERHASHLKN